MVIVPPKTPPTEMSTVEKLLLQVLQENTKRQQVDKESATRHEQMQQQHQESIQALITAVTTANRNPGRGAIGGGGGGAAGAGAGGSTGGGTGGSGSAASDIPGAKLAKALAPLPHDVKPPAFEQWRRTFESYLKMSRLATCNMEMQRIALISNMTSKMQATLHHTLKI